MIYTYFLEIGLIILFVKLFTLVTHKIHIPKVLGALIVGVLLGPAVLNVVHKSSFIDILSNIAIIFIMFIAGMETRLKSFISGTKKFAIIAVCGVIVPLIFGFLFSKFYTSNIAENLFFGIVITATSVSITIEALMELKKMKTNVGLAILGAGVFDDIIGIVFLTFVMNSSSLTASTFILIAAKIFLFFIVAVAFGLLVHTLFGALGKLVKNEDVPIYAISYALIMAYVAEKFGVSGIIGSYIAGLVIGTTPTANKTKKQIDTLVNLFFSPIFFASIGLNLTSLNFPVSTWIFIIGFATITILSKIIGNGLGARLCGYKRKDALRIGIGMSTRGEVALIMLEEAIETNLINSEIFSIILVSILLVNIVSPILLNLSFEKNKKEEIVEQKNPS